MPRSRVATRSVSVSVVLMLIYLLFISFMQMCRGDAPTPVKGGAKSCNVSFCVVSIVLLIIVF